MRSIRRATTALLLLIQLVIPADASGQGGSSSGTQVAVDAPIVTITVTIDMVFNDPNAEGTQETVDSIEQAIMDYWNDAFDEFGNQCVYFNLVVEINPVPKSALREIPLDGGRSTMVTTPGHHTVIWEGSGPNAPWPETFDPYDSDLVAPPGEDYTSPYAHDLWAIWSGHLDTPRDYAHEFGHLLGFGDDVGRFGVPLPGREGTLMDNGDEIDQVLIDRLNDVVRDSGKKLPECWEGTITGTSTALRGPCDVRYEGEITIVASDDGTATLEGTITTTGTGGCPFEPSTSSLGSNPGQRTPSGFEFPGFLIANAGIDVSGNHGTGTTTGQTADGIYEYRFEIDCVSCPASDSA